MSRIRCLFLVFIAFAQLLTAGVACADDQELAAKEKFGEGMTAHARGDYVTAAALFEAAYRLLPAAGAKFNAGIAWDQAGEFPRAADAYETALEMGGLTEEEARQADERLGALKKLLGTVSIDAPVGAIATVEHQSGPVPLRVHLEPGLREIRAELQGATSLTRVEVRAGEVQHVALRLSSREPPKPPPALAAPLPARHPAPDQSHQEREGPRDRTWGWIALASGVALGGVAAFLGTQTLDARSEWDASGHRDLGKRDKAVALRTWTNVGWGGALVAGGIGATLLIAPTFRF
jgi:tetratricopeptide (TPR) repeat protein